MNNTYLRNLGFLMLTAFFVSCGKNEPPKLTAKSSASKRSFSGDDLTGSANFKCDLSSKKCPQIDFNLKLIEPMSPKMGQNTRYRIEVKGVQDPSRKFKFWLENPSELGGPIPGPSEDGILDLGNYTLNKPTIALIFKVRDLDRCSLDAGPSNCEEKGFSSPADSSGRYTIADPTGVASSSSGSSSSGISDAEIFKRCEEAWDAKTKGDSGFLSVLPGLLGGATSIISGDTKGGITGIIGGVTGIISGGSSSTPKPSTLSECKAFLGIP